MTPPPLPAGRHRRPQPTRVTVSSASDLLGLVPYLLGFRPAESLVLLVLRSGRVQLTARVDLPPPAGATAVVDQLLRLTERGGASSVILLGYGADAEATRAVLAVAVSTLEPRGLLEALYVGDDRWWSLVCRGSCCPAEGTPYQPSSSPMAAEAVFAGLTAADGRRQIEDLVRGPTDQQRRALEPVVAAELERLATVGDSGRRLRMAGLVAAFLDRPRRLSDRDCVELALLAGGVGARDVAWSRMTRDDADLHVDLWTQVVSRTLSPWEPAPLCLLGMAAWITGNGALQNCCAERASRLDPGYSMAGLLDEINQRALPPSCWDELASQLADDGSLAPGAQGALG